MRASSNKGHGCLYNIFILPFVLIFQLYGLLFKGLVWLFKTATATPERRKISLFAVGGITVLSVGMIAVTALLQAVGIVPIGTPTPTFDLVSFQSTAQAGVFISFTQTAQALPTWTYTATTVSTETATLFPSPTATPIPTDTPLPTATIYVPPVVQPTAAGHPAGTSGQCVDGHLTSAQHKQGACSSHGGVAIWWGP